MCMVFFILCERRYTHNVILAYRFPVVTVHCSLRTVHVLRHFRGSAYRTIVSNNMFFLTYSLLILLSLSFFLSLSFALFLSPSLSFSLPLSPSLPTLSLHIHYRTLVFLTLFLATLPSTPSPALTLSFTSSPPSSPSCLRHSITPSLLSTHPPPLSLYCSSPFVPSVCPFLHQSYTP